MFGPQTNLANRHSLKPGLLPELLGYRLRLAQQALFRGILLLLEANPGVTQSRLAEAVGLDRSTMVGVLHALQDRGLVERRRGEDRRTNGLWLTAQGRGLVGGLKRRIQLHERRVAARLSPAERAQLIGLLEKLAG